MGFLKNLRAVGKEVSKDHDVKSSMAEASRAMQAATDALTGGGDLAERGEPAMAQVTGTRAANMLVNHSPMLEVDMLVFREGKPPYPASMSMPSTSGVPAPGTQMRVLVDPDNPSRVVLG